MSSPKKKETNCSYCGARINRWIWDSIDLERHPEASEKLRNGAYFKTVCPSCGRTFIEEYPMACFDNAKGVYVQFVTDNDWERFLYLDELLNDGLRLCKVYRSYELTEKVFALQNGRDDRIVEMCKFWILLQFAIHINDFELNRLCYSIEGEKEKIVGVDSKGNMISTDFPEDVYQAFESSFRDLLPGVRAKFDVYDTEWADGFLWEHVSLFRRSIETIRGKG